MDNRNIFLDTNIVVDIVDPARIQHLQSLELLKNLTLEDYNIYISEDMITTLYYISRDKKVVLEFLRGLVYVDWNVSMFGIDLLSKATNLSLKEDLDLEDLLQCLCAKENGCNILITNDKKFCNCGIEIMNCEEFLKK